MMIIFWALIVYLIYIFISKNKGEIGFKNIRNNEDNIAEKILKNRYVNGEIDEETYKKMMKNISK